MRSSASGRVKAPHRASKGTTFRSEKGTTTTSEEGPPTHLTLNPNSQRVRLANTCPLCSTRNMYCAAASQPPPPSTASAGSARVHSTSDRPAPSSTWFELMSSGSTSRQRA